MRRPLRLAADPLPSPSVLKRACDLVVAIVLLVGLAPLLALTALAIMVDDRGPVLFRQRRVGYQGRTFSIFKFRSMTVDAEDRLSDLLGENERDGLLFKMPDDPRITRVGRLIRRLSIDELPQLWNVVRGEMSLVGPRPLPVEAHHFDDVARRRHEVRPGITGPWQIRQCDAGYREMVTLDIDYIDRWSLGADLRLLARTVPAVLRRRGPAAS